MKRRIPKFKSLEEERKFWDTHSITDFMDELNTATVKFTKQKKRLISLRLDVPQIQCLKEIASQKGLGYLTLIRSWIKERLTKEHRHRFAHR